MINQCTSPGLTPTSHTLPDSCQRQHPGRQTIAETHLHGWGGVEDWCQAWVDRGTGGSYAKPGAETVPSLEQKLFLCLPRLGTNPPPRPGGLTRPGGSSLLAPRYYFSTCHPERLPVCMPFRRGVAEVMMSGLCIQTQQPFYKMLSEILHWNSGCIESSTMSKSAANSDLQHHYMWTREARLHEESGLFSRLDGVVFSFFFFFFLFLFLHVDMYAITTLYEPRHSIIY